MSDAPGADDEAADRTPAETAQLALLLEVAGTPKPGNVDRRRDLGDLRFEHFLAGAVGAGEGLRMAAAGAPVGRAFERAVDGMARQRGGNTQFGCLLLLVPLVAARAAGDLSPAGVAAVVADTTVEDAADFYRAFEHVDVAVPDPGDEEIAALDVRRGADAIPAVREREVTLADVMELSAERDGNAREWAGGFERTFGAAEAMLADEGPAPDRVARAFLELLAEEPDSLVETRHGARTAEHVRERAAAVAGDLEAAETLAEDLAAEGINPGTTADVTAAATYVALERGLPV
ncbi:MAG: triphosphoribosyl-dephospho-CoA synthase [Haloferacaceae archaeon]